jgi:DNA ligase D-like protein (predicted 3'-phosphoesterase)
VWKNQFNRLAGPILRGESVDLPGRCRRGKSWHARKVLQNQVFRGLVVEQPAGYAGWRRRGALLMKLKEYRKKRHFDVSPEPQGQSEPSKKKSARLIYVVQKHRASRLHYDFRLEWNGTLLSWAVPKGPSLDPSVKRLAMKVEDHPIEYAKFEGVIPKGEYGGGTVMVWDRGTWEPDEEDVDASLRRGELKFTLYGEKLRGSWVLVRTRGYGSGSDRSWLLIKHRDAFASQEDISIKAPRSVASNRLLAEIARDEGGDVEQAATGDPVSKATRPTLGKKILPHSRRARSQKA